MKETVLPYTIILTRSQEDSEIAVPVFRRYGFNVLVAPVIETRYADLTAPLKAALSELDQEEFNWIILTSRNGVKALAELQRKGALRAKIPSSTKICVVGDGTGSEVRSIFNREPDLIPVDQRAKGILQAFIGSKLPNQKILIPCAMKSASDLSGELSLLGHQVKSIVVYRTESCSPDQKTLAAINSLDPSRSIFTFFSPSAFRACADVFGAKLGQAKLASIGPTTSESITKAGMRVWVESRERAADSLAQAIKEKSSISSTTIP